MEKRFVDDLLCAGILSNDSKQHPPESTNPKAIVELNMADEGTRARIMHIFIRQICRRGPMASIHDKQLERKQRDNQAIG